MKIGNLYGKIAVIALVTIGALLILVYYYGAAGGRLPGAENRYTFHAVVDEPQQLLKHADVRAAGVKVGEVVAITGEGRKANVTMDLEDRIAPIYQDAQVLVRQKTLVGENYVEVNRGTPSSGQLPDGGTLPPAANKEAVPIDRVLNSLDAPTRKAISTNLRALGGGFEGHGDDLNRFAAALVPLTSDGSQVTDILNAQSKQVADIIQQGSTVFSALADRRNDLRSLLKAATTTAKAVSARDTQLSQDFADFPATLRQARGTVTRLSAFSGRATPVVRDLKLAATDLAPVVQDLGPTATSANKVFDELPRFTQKANPLLGELTTFAKAGKPAFPALEASLRQLNPFLRYLAPYNKDVAGTMGVFGDNIQYDKYGARARCTCILGPHSLSNYTPAMKQALSVLLEKGVLGQFDHSGNDAFKKPGTANDLGATTFSGAYPHVTADK